MSIGSALASLVLALFISFAFYLLSIFMVVLSVKLHSRFLKRLLDIAFATSGIVLALPVMSFIALIMKLQSTGPIFLSSRQTAPYGKVFARYKFRTPYNAPPTPMDMHICSAWNLCLTRIGRYLNITRMDELPELINLLKGDITLSEYGSVVSLRTFFGVDSALRLPVELKTHIVMRLLCWLNPAVFVTYAWYLSEKRERWAVNSGRIYIAVYTFYYIMELLFSESYHLARSFLHRVSLLVKVR